jgi:uncharacterized membrane protein
MKRIEKFVLILSIVTAIKVCAAPFITSVLKPQILSGPSQAAANALSSLGWISAIAFVLVNLVCGILLLLESKEEKLSQWVWLLFGLTFGLEAVIMFYLYMLFVEIKLKWKRSDESAS